MTCWILTQILLHHLWVYGIILAKGMVINIEQEFMFSVMISMVLQICHIITGQEEVER